jgi:prevent-host-death family protein
VILARVKRASELRILRILRIYLSLGSTATMITVTAAELQKQFGRYRDAAIREPVAVTHHGRESLVVLSADEYRRLKALDTQQAVRPWDLPDDLVSALDAAEVPPDAAAFNHEYR